MTDQWSFVDMPLISWYQISVQLIRHTKKKISYRWLILNLLVALFNAKMVDQRFDFEVMFNQEQNLIFCV